MLTGPTALSLPVSSRAQVGMDLLGPGVVTMQVQMPRQAAAGFMRGPHTGRGPLITNQIEELVVQLWLDTAFGALTGGLTWGAGCFWNHRHAEEHQTIAWAFHDPQCRLHTVERYLCVEGNRASCRPDQQTEPIAAATSRRLSRCRSAHGLTDVSSSRVTKSVL